MPGIDVEKTAGIIDIIKSMTSRQLAVTLLLIALSVGLSFWFEKRYAKLVDYQNDLKIQQDRITAQEKDLNKLKFNMLAVVNSLDPETRKKVFELSNTNIILTGNTSNVPNIPQPGN